MGAKSPSTLAAFAYNWIGGDIHGLSAYSGTLYGYVPEITNVVTALDNRVQRIVGDASWTGTASSAFTKAWERDSSGATALGLVISQTGDIVNGLAVNLANIESALEQAADQTTKAGVPIGADGQPPQECFADANKESWRASYQTFWNDCMLEASQARTQAAGELQTVYGQIAPPAAGDSGLAPGDYNTLADYLRGFWALPTGVRKVIESKIPAMETAVKKAVTDAREEARLANGRFGPWKDADAARFGAARTTLDSTKTQLADAASHENLVTKALAFSASDVPAVGDALKNADGLTSLLKAASDIPVIDIAAAGVGTYFGAQQDIDEYHRPAAIAYPAEAASNVAGLAAGAWVGGLAGGAAAAGATALGIAGAPVLGVAAGVAVGGIVAIGVGDFGHNLIDENWGQDIQQHGVAMGVVDGIGDSAVKTGKDIGHLASSAWHGITSIF
ncbi:MAG TPA: hypothetical protein VH333_21565 [Pseudonocardiaceae bacterium]|jgi:uncharacterized protein YukE|nr:hypothetical protein [Pseudonocardiaceae bacterium]